MTTAVAVSCTTDATGQQCKASAQMSDGSTRDVTSSAAWSSSDVAVATVGPTGHVLHIASGQAEIRATYQDHFGGAIILVNVSVLGVSVTCTESQNKPWAPEALIHPNIYICRALASLSNGAMQDVTSSGAVWSSSNPSVATVDSAGRVVPLTNGQTQIAARFQSVVSGLVLTLSDVRLLTSISVLCIAEPDAHQCAAIGHFSDGTVDTITSLVTWTSSDTTVALVDGNSGRVRHRSSGQVEIRVTYGNVAGSVVLDVVVTLTGTSVVINEFATRSNDGSTDDWAELRNDTSAPVDISGWELREWNTTSQSVGVRFVAAGVVLAPGCHYLLANRAAVDGLTRDARMDNVNLAGGLALLRADGTIVDQVGYSANSPFREGSVLAPMEVDDSRSYTRIGNDTNNNGSDFRLLPRTPLNSTSSCAVR